jgi:hypothetical protein
MQNCAIHGEYYSTNCPECEREAREASKVCGATENEQLFALAIAETLSLYQAKALVDRYRAARTTKSEALRFMREGVGAVSSAYQQIVELLEAP